MRSRIICAALLAVLSVSPVLAKPLEYIRDAQRKLAHLGYAAGELDGEFDAEFTAALNRFKIDAQLPPDGRYDTAAREALSKAFATGSPRAHAVAVTPLQPVPAPVYAPAYPPPVAPPPPQPMAPPVPASAPAPTPTPAAPTAWYGGLFFAPLLEVSLEFGGDPVATATLTDGSTAEIETGRGMTIAGGMLVRPFQRSPYAALATVGYKFGGVFADNGDLQLDRIVAEALVSYRFGPGIVASGGVVYHANIGYECELDNDPVTGASRCGPGGSSVDFENAVGGTAELGWRWLTASYTLMDYEDEFGGEYDANNFGLTFRWAFGD